MHCQSNWRVGSNSVRYSDIREADRFKWHESKRVEQDGRAHSEILWHVRWICHSTRNRHNGIHKFGSCLHVERITETGGHYRYIGACIDRPHQIDYLFFGSGGSLFVRFRKNIISECGLIVGSVHAWHALCIACGVPGLQLVPSISCAIVRAKLPTVTAI